MNDINDLRRQFSIPGVVHIEPGHGGLTRVAIMTEQAEAHVYLHGAHITHYRPRAGQDVLFLSAKSLFEAGKAIRGGVPVIFPWFGAKADNATAPAHGFVRNRPWELRDIQRSPDGSVALVLELASSADTQKFWPNEFRLRYTVTVGSSLEMSLEVRNISHADFKFESALHTYLAVDDVKKVRIDGLGGREFLDKTDSTRRKKEGSEKIAITGETDRVYLNTNDTVLVHDPDLAREISVEKEGSRATVLWNPWIAKAKAMADFGDEEWPEMLCVETANVAENAVLLPAGQSHRMLARVSWKPLAEKSGGGSVKQWEMSHGHGAEHS
ncbi:MAG TPA: D-hexose-6-phosphate mutarotase [Tepidisphaeraceae bacterium]|jgi:D-hexose-6-phosphate mutarotase|nr:D-hexose-6-phosphate mutarotase [Tepidisphaeraceae bacterium]